MKKILILLMLLPLFSIGQTQTEWTNLQIGGGQNVVTFKTTLENIDVAKYVKCYVDELPVILKGIKQADLFVDTLDLTGNNVVRFETIVPFKTGKTFDRFSIQVTPYSKPIKDTIK